VFSSSHVVEIRDKLVIYEQLLVKWSASLNLVAKSTLSNVWLRHFEDSLQLVPFLSSTDRIVDIGSGAGFPGMVLALCGFDVTLIESDQKKCVFLENVSRETSSRVEVVCSRIEKHLPSVDDRFDVVCSRGLTSLSELISLSQNLIRKDQSRGLFLKGMRVDNEISEISIEQLGRVEKIKSRTDQNSSIIKYQF
jgi:16S rRNA (guanine527-N7)-methyltransferase